MIVTLVQRDTLTNLQGSANFRHANHLLIEKSDNCHVIKHVITYKFYRVSRRTSEYLALNTANSLSSEDFGDKKSKSLFVLTLRLM